MMNLPSHQAPVQLEPTTKDHHRRGVIRKSLFTALGLLTGWALLPRTANAQTRISLESLNLRLTTLEATVVQLSNTVTSSQTALTALQTSVAALQSQIGSVPTVFTRYGNSAAPAGTSLLYSGIAYAAFYSHTGGPKTPIVLPQPATSGNVLNGESGNSYPLVTAVAGSGTGILPANRRVDAAVCLAPRPVATFWGTTTPPAGWTTLYSGVGYSSYYTHSGSLTEAILIDTSLTGPAVTPSGALVYPIITDQSNGYQNRQVVLGVVAMKNA